MKWLGIILMVMNINIVFDENYFFVIEVLI